jgi:hypothetical protein
MNLRFKVEDDNPGIMATRGLGMINEADMTRWYGTRRLCKNSTFASVCAYVITQCILEIERLPTLYCLHHLYSVSTGSKVARLVSPVRPFDSYLKMWSIRLIPHTTCLILLISLADIALLVTMVISFASERIAWGMACWIA